MKLSEWNQIRETRKKKQEKSLYPHQIKAGVTSDPKDYYFAIYVDEENYDYVDGKRIETPRTGAVICPRKYFDEKGHCYDGHVLGIVKIPGFAEDMESVISPSASMPDLDPADMHELLTDIGLVWTEKFANFVNNHDPANGTVFFPKNT